MRIRAQVTRGELILTCLSNNRRDARIYATKNLGDTRPLEDVELFKREVMSVMKEGGESYAKAHDARRYTSLEVS